jgi:tellurite resistance protein TerC
VVLWLSFFLLVILLLVLYRSTGAAMARRPAFWTAIWFAVGLGFVGFVYPLYEHGWLGAELSEPSDRPGFDAATMFVSAYLVEYVLAFDNIFVTAEICTLHRVPKKHQLRVIFWALVGGILVRIVVMAGSASLARAFDWSRYVVGVFAVCWIVTLLRPEEDEERPRTDSDSAVVQLSRMPVARLLWRKLRLTDRDATGRFWARERGRRVLTMAAVCMISIALADATFALDTAAAVVAVSKTTFIVVAANVFATIALRGWFLMLGTVENVRPPRFAIAALLAVIAFKLLAGDHMHVPHVVALAVIVAIIGAAVAESLSATRRTGLPPA